MSPDPTDLPEKTTPLTPDQKTTYTDIMNRKARINALKVEKGESDKNFQVVEDDSRLATLQLMAGTGAADQDAANLLLNQVINAQHAKNDVKSVNGTIALTFGMEPRDEIEGMLAVQTVAAHNLALEYARRSMGTDLTLKQANHLIHWTTKLMGLTVRQIEALQKYRAKGQQQIIVKHQQVTVNEGGQAVIGNVHPQVGGRGET